MFIKHICAAVWPSQKWSKWLPYRYCREQTLAGAVRCHSLRNCITSLLSVDINKLGNDGRPLTLTACRLYFFPIIPFLALGSYLRRPCSILMFELLSVSSVSRRNSQKTQPASIINIITRTHASPRFKKKCEFEVQILIKVPDIQNLTNSVQWEPKCLMRTDGQADGYPS
jgi:hypothetical protein